MTESQNGSREAVLARIRRAVSAAPAAPMPERAYRDSHIGDDPAALAELLAVHLADYRARVHRAAPGDVAPTVARLVAEFGSGRIVHPADLPPGWLPDSGTSLVPDDGTLAAAELDAGGSVVTGCAVAIAETGTLVLDAGPGQGRRLLTLVPDHHICVVRVPDQVVASVAQALRRLDPARPQTWISGPSATSDIELSRVEGVHGPRTLDVVLVEGRGPEARR